MPENKPYVDFMFMGAKSFTGQLKEAGTEFKILEDKNTEILLSEEGSIFNKETDAIIVGFASRDENEFYFIEFGIKLSLNVTSYIVFLYKNHPSIEDMKKTSLDIEPLANEYLGSVKKQNLKEEDFPADSK